MINGLRASVVVTVVLHASLAFAQTNAAKASAVGTWEMDLKQSSFGSEAPPKSVTLIIVKDTPAEGSWRVEVVDGKGESMSYSWSGPQDGTLQALKAGNGQEIGKESLKRDGDVLLRHGEDPSGGSFDSRGTMSADGNTITDVTTTKSKDGKTSKTTAVYHRVTGGDRGGK